MQAPHSHVKMSVMASRYFCDICDEEIHTTPDELGYETIELLWEGYRLELKGAIKTTPQETAQSGDVCRSCLRKAISDNLIDMLCNNLDAEE